MDKYSFMTSVTASLCRHRRNLWLWSSNLFENRVGCLSFHSACRMGSFRMGWVWMNSCCRRTLPFSKRKNDQPGQSSQFLRYATHGVDALWLAFCCKIFSSDSKIAWVVILLIEEPSLPHSTSKLNLTNCTVVSSGRKRHELHEWAYGMIQIPKILWTIRESTLEGNQLRDFGIHIDDLRYVNLVNARVAQG